MVNYNNSYIYKLCCKDLTIEDIYIGSTTNFTRRKCSHKCRCNNINHKSYNYKVYEFIRENGNWENWDMILVENVNVNTKLDLLKIERKFIEELKPSLNNNIPLRTDKQYRDDTKQHKKEYTKKYIIKNKDKLNKKYNCEICGGKYNYSTKSRHEKSKKHQLSLAYTEPCTNTE